MPQLIGVNTASRILSLCFFSFERTFKWYIEAIFVKKDCPKLTEFKSVRGFVFCFTNRPEHNSNKCSIWWWHSTNFQRQNLIFNLLMIIKISAKFPTQKSNRPRRKITKENIPRYLQHNHHMQNNDDMVDSSPSLNIRCQFVGVNIASNTQAAFSGKCTSS